MLVEEFNGSITPEEALAAPDDVSSAPHYWKRWRWRGCAGCRRCSITFGSRCAKRRKNNPSKGREQWLPLTPALSRKGEGQSIGFSHRSQPVSVTESPWFWVMLFSLAGLAAVATVGPKFEQREASIEAQISCAERALGARRSTSRAMM